MGCGVESAILQNTGVLTMPEWCVANWSVLVSMRSYSVDNSSLYKGICLCRFILSRSAAVWDKS